MVFCHGFLGWHRKPRLVPFQEELAKSFSVYSFDFRGHGRSGGASSLGGREHLDVEAVAERARADGLQRLVTFGGSMGGIAAIRHAALVGGVNAVVAVSTPARWDGHESAAVRRLLWRTGTFTGRWVLQPMGVPVAPRIELTEAPGDLVAKIAPTPLLIAHGRDDPFFEEEEAWTLYAAAGQPKRLLIADRFGHAEDGYTPAFARAVTRWISEMVAA